MATNQRGHFPYEGEIGVGQPVSILRLTDTPSYIPVGTPQFSFRRFGGRSRAARRVKFSPANQS